MLVVVLVSLLIVTCVVIFASYQLVQGNKKTAPTAPMSSWAETASLPAPSRKETLYSALLACQKDVWHIAGDAMLRVCKCSRNSLLVQRISTVDYAERRGNSQVHLEYIVVDRANKVTARYVVMEVSPFSHDESCDRLIRLPGDDELAMLADAHDSSAAEPEAVWQELQRQVAVATVF